MQLSEKWYEFFKKLVRIILPAIGAFYFALAKIWGFPGGEDVVGTITITCLFLGTILGISTSNYEGDGTIDLSSDHQNQIISVHGIDMSEITPEKLAGKKQVVLRVKDRTAA